MAEENQAPGERVSINPEGAFLREERMREALAKVALAPHQLPPQEKASWVSRLASALGTVFFGSPASYGMKKDLYYLPFERTEQVPDRPDQFDLDLVRDNLYINDFRRRMLSSFAWPVAIYLGFLVVLAPMAMNKVGQWNSQWKAHAESSKQENVKEILAELGAASYQSCEKVLPIANEIMTEKLALMKENQEINRENEALAIGGTPKPMKTPRADSSFSAKEQAYFRHAQSCSRFYREDNGPGQPITMAPKPATATP